MKKKIFAVLTALLCLTLALAAVSCDGPVDTQEYDEPYSIEVNGTTVALGAKASSVLNKLGEPKSSQNTGNCGGLGETTRYVYGGFVLTVVDYEDGDALIDKIELTDDSVETSSGIYIGSTKDSVIDVYGQADNEKSGALIYKTSGKETTFGIKDGKVISITMRVVD